MKSLKRVRKYLKGLVFECKDYSFLINPEINNHNNKQGKPYVRYWQIVKCSKL